MNRGWFDERPAEAGADVGEGVDGLHHARVGGVVEGVDPVAYLVDDVDLAIRPTALFRMYRSLYSLVDGLGRIDALGRIDGPGRIDGLRKFGGRSDRRMSTACERNIPSLLDEWTTQAGAGRREPASERDAQDSYPPSTGACRPPSTRTGLVTGMAARGCDRLVAGHGAVQVEFFDEGCSGGCRGLPAFRRLRCWRRSR